jgi:hypothetical protein
MTAINYAITTKEKVKTLLGLSGSTNDALIDLLCAQVTDFIEGYCGGRRFLSTTHSNEVHDTENVHNIFLNHYPITSLSAVEYRTGTFSSPVWASFIADGYLLYGDEGYVYFAGKLPAIKQGMRFTYVAGYLIDWANETNIANHTLPFDLTGVATALAGRMFSSRGTDGIKSQSTEGQSVTFNDPDKFLSETDKYILGRYQAIRVTK